jgi:hypothetical protein
LLLTPNSNPVVANVTTVASNAIGRYTSRVDAMRRCLD